MFELKCGKTENYPDNYVVAMNTAIATLHFLQKPWEFNRKKVFHGSDDGIGLKLYVFQRRVGIPYLKIYLQQMPTLNHGNIWTATAAEYQWWEQEIDEGPISIDEQDPDYELYKDEVAEYNRNRKYERNPHQISFRADEFGFVVCRRRLLISYTETAQIQFDDAVLEKGRAWKWENMAWEVRFPEPSYEETIEKMFCELNEE